MSRRIAVARGCHATGRRRVAAGDPHRMAVGPADRRLAIRDRDSAGAHLRERAAARRRAHRRPRSRAHRHTSGRRPPSAVNPSRRSPAGLSRTTRPSRVHLDDQVRRAVDDRLKLVSLLLERLAQAGPGERDRELVSGELRDPQAVLIQGPVLDRPHDEHGLRRLVGEGQGATARRRGAHGGDAVEPVAIGRPEPERPGSRPGQPDELGQHGGGEVGEAPARRDELAQLVLREQCVGLALGLVEGPAPLALQRVDPREQRVAVGHGRVSHRPGRAAAAGTRRPPGRGDQSPDRRGASRGPDERRAGAWIACPAPPRAGRPRTPPRDRLRAGARARRSSAAGARASRIVLSPTAHRPRRATPAAAASNIAASSWASDRRDIADGRAGLEERRPVAGARRPRPRWPRGDGRRRGAARRAACRPAALPAAGRPHGSRSRGCRRGRRRRGRHRAG